MCYIARPVTMPPGHNMLFSDLDLNVHSSGNGMPLLWAHGMLSSIATEKAGDDPWPEPPDGVRLIRYDARGHGDSAWSTQADDYTWPSLSRDMLGVAAQHAPGPLLLGGASMGCATAIHAALTAPARVRGLILAFPPAIWTGRTAHARLYARMARSGTGLPEPGAARADILRHLYDGAARSNLPPPEAFAALARTPVLLLARRGDPVHPLASSSALLRVLPQAQQLLLAEDEGVAARAAEMAAFASACVSAEPKAWP